MGKKIILSIVAIILAYNTVKLVNIFTQLSPDDFNRIGRIAISIALNLMITGVFAFPGFVFATHKALPDAFYSIRNPKLLNRVYTLLGVKYFRILLLMTFYRNEDNKKYFNGTKAGIVQFDYHTKQSEFGHFAALLVITAVSFIILGYGHTAAFVLMMAINVIFNLYPIVLQRKHRIQIERITKRFKV